MMIYLSLLGPVAKDAIPAVRGGRINNPVLPSATLWAIECDKRFPWATAGPADAGDGGRPGPPRGVPGFGGDGPEFARYVYEAYVHELGDRLRPAAVVLANKIVDGSAGEVPAWGYKNLRAGGNEVLGMLAGHLSDKDLASRERATVALGYMGSAAAPAKAQLTTALNRAPSEREKHLLEWCLREIAG